MSRANAIRILLAKSAKPSAMKQPTGDQLIASRLGNQRLTRTTLRRPGDVVHWLGAAQAQDFATAKWGLALRARVLTEAAVDRAFNDGAILRTHALRPTWHFVTPADIRWILALTAPRVHAANAPYYLRNRLDRATLAKSRTVLERALRDAAHLTRVELAAALGARGIRASGERLAYIMMHAELEQVICSGPRRGKQFTYALLDERVPAAKTLPRDEALATLTRRYFTSHGPATVRDFAWWSGLTARDARTGIEMVKPALAQAPWDGLTYWFASAQSSAPPAAPTAHLLPNYDEYLIAYQDRALVNGGPMPRPRLDVYAYFLLLDGRLAGTWRRTVQRDSVRVQVAPIKPVTRTNRAALAEAVRAATLLRSTRHP
jgi:hypothetical protein